MYSLKFRQNLVCIDDIHKDFIPTEESIKKHIITLNKVFMNIAIEIDYQQLIVINNMMAQLDNITFAGLKKNLKTVVSICIDLREKLLQKAIKMRYAEKKFKLKLKYYMAEALYNYLTEFHIYFDDGTLGSYINNTLTIIKNQLHQRLQ